MAAFTLKATKAEKTNDPARNALVHALQQYDQGNFKATISHGATALNLIASQHDLNGGGWS